MALGEIALAYDGRELFECAAHLFFPNVETPHDFLSRGKKVLPASNLALWFGNEETDLVDLVAAVHLVRFPLKEPERMPAALKHLEATLALSRQSWKCILAETDDDHEWIPNPRQTSAIGNMRVTQAMVDSWLHFLDEAEELLAGRRLLPFWRANDGRGVNLRKVFLEPRPFDLVLWIQGTAATPYLENGPLTRPEVWQQLTRVFGGNFMQYAIWFN
jgi:hypothetical protein